MDLLREDIAADLGETFGPIADVLEEAGLTIADVAEVAATTVAKGSATGGKVVGRETADVFNSIVDGLTKAYDGWMAARQTTTKSVERELENVAKLLVKGGITIADVSSAIDDGALTIDKTIGRWIKKEATSLLKPFLEGDPPPKAIEERLRNLLVDAQDDLKLQKESSAILDETLQPEHKVKVELHEKNLRDEINRLEDELGSQKDDITDRRDRRDNANEERTELAQTIKDAEEWFENAEFTARGADAQEDLAEIWNDAANDLFGQPVLEASDIIAGQGLRGFLLDVQNGFREELDRVKSDLSEITAVRDDLDDEITALDESVFATQQDIKKSQSDLKAGLPLDVDDSTRKRIDERLANAPSADATDEEIITWLLGDPNEPSLGFADDLEELTVFDPDFPIPGLPGMRHKIDTVMAGRDFGQGRLGTQLRERESQLSEVGSDRETLRREYATETEEEEEDFSPESVERDAITVEGDSDGFSPEAIRRREEARAAIDPDEPFSPERLRRYERGEETLTAADLIRRDRSRFLGHVPTPDEEVDEEIAAEVVEDEEALVTRTDPASQRGGFDLGDQSMLPLPQVTNGDPSQLTDAASEYIKENFGSVAFFMQDDKFNIDTNGDGFKDTNIIDFLESTTEENPDVIWGLFQKTDWFRDNGPSARQFQMDWGKAGGTDNWLPMFDEKTGQWMNMNKDMNELLDDTYDALIQEAERIGIDTNQKSKKEAIMQMAYNARQLNMTEYEMKSEFIDNVNLAFDPDAVKNSGTFGAIRNKLKSNAAAYMITLDDTSLDRFSQDLYLGKATYEGLNASFTEQARNQNPAIASLIDQGYTPSAYFSSYANAASNLLGRPVDFMGGDNKMYRTLTNTMTGENGMERPMTRGEFERYVRSTPEWDTSEDARDEAYSTVGTLLSSFGINA